MSGPISTRKQKIDWLLAHQQLWEGYAQQDRRYRSIVFAMRDAGLYAKKVEWTLVALWNLIREARQIRREVKR